MRPSDNSSLSSNGSESPRHKNRSGWNNTTTTTKVGGGNDSDSNSVASVRPIPRALGGSAARNFLKNANPPIAPLSIASGGGQSAARSISSNRQEVNSLDASSFRGESPRGLNGSATHNSSKNRNAPKASVKTSILDNAYRLNESVVIDEIDEGKQRNLQIKKLRKGEGLGKTEEFLRREFVGLESSEIQQLVTFKIVVLGRPVMRIDQDPDQSFDGNIQTFEGHDKWTFGARRIYKSDSLSREIDGAFSATSFSLVNEDPLRDLKQIINSEASCEDKLESLKGLSGPHNSKAREIVGRYRDLQLTDSYKVTCIEMESELISKQIDHYKKDLEEAFNSYFSSHINGIAVGSKLSDLSAHMCKPNYKEDIDHIARGFNEKYKERLDERNEIEINQIKNYEHLTAAEKRPSVQKFKSRILSEDQYKRVFKGVTLSGVQFTALEEIESSLLNPKSRSKPLVSFNMGEGKTFLIELVKKYAEEIDGAKGLEQYRQADLKEKQEDVETLKFRIEEHKEAIGRQRHERSFARDGSSIPVEDAKALLKETEDRLEEVSREVNQIKLRGLKIEIIDRANEETKLNELNAKGNLEKTLIFWDESRYGLQDSSKIKLGSQLRGLKDKGANLVLVGATVNELKLVEALNRAKDKGGKFGQQAYKVERDLKEFRKRKARAINKILSSKIEEEAKAFPKNWAEIVKNNHGVDGKKSQHVFLDQKLEVLEKSELEAGLKAIIKDENSPQIAMINFIESGEYRCLIAKKGQPIINTKVGNRNYYRAILQGGEDILSMAEDPELSADGISEITRGRSFVNNIAEVYGERYSIGGVYDRVDVLQEADTQILYVSEKEKINLAEIGQAQSRNRGSKPLTGKIVIHGDWASQVMDPQDLAKMALENFEKRDRKEFVEDLDLKMTKYLPIGLAEAEAVLTKFSEVLAKVNPSKEEQVQIIGGDAGLIEKKFLQYIPPVEEGDLRHKFIRDLKLLIHYSSLLSKLSLDYKPLLLGDYEREFDNLNLSQSLSTIDRDSGAQSSLTPIGKLQDNEAFIDHFSRLTYSRKTQQCLERELEEAKEAAIKAAKEAKRNQEEEIKKQAAIEFKLKGLRIKEEALEKYLSDINRGAEESRQRGIALESKGKQLVQQVIAEHRQLDTSEADERKVTEGLLVELENIRERIADGEASRAGLVSKKESALSEERLAESGLKNLLGAIDAIKAIDEGLPKARSHLQLASNQIVEKDQALTKSEADRAERQSQLMDLKIEGDKWRLELSKVTAASNKKAAEIQAIERTIEESSILIQGLDRRKAECDASIGSFSEEIERLSKTINALSLRNDGLEKGALKQKKHLDSLEENLSGLKSVWKG